MSFWPQKKQETEEHGLQLFLPLLLFSQLLSFISLLPQESQKERANNPTAAAFEAPWTYLSKQRYVIIKIIYVYKYKYTFCKRYRSENIYAVPNWLKHWLRDDLKKVMRYLGNTSQRMFRVFNHNHDNNNNKILSWTPFKWTPLTSALWHAIASAPSARSSASASLRSLHRPSHRFHPRLPAAQRCYVLRRL